MTLSAISNPTLAKNQVAQQKTGAAPEQLESKNASASNGSAAKDTVGDNVSLSQSEKTSFSGKVITEETAKTLLPQTLKAIIGDSKTALATQANTTSQVAQEILTNG